MLPVESGTDTDQGGERGARPQASADSGASRRKGSGGRANFRGKQPWLLAPFLVLQGRRDGVSFSEGRRHEAIMSAVGSFPQAGASGQERRKGELLP